MERHKSNDSTISTTATTTTPPHSDKADNNLNYINLNFIDNSESSIHSKSTTMESSNPERTILQSLSRPVKSVAPSINLAANFTVFGTQAPNQATVLEKSLVEMGYVNNDVVGWELIDQPPKQNLYILLKNMINNHIKPNVQIRIGQVNFNCHMMVLQCYSEFFMDCTNEVLIQLPEEKITPAAFMMVYDWMLADQPLVQRMGILQLFNAASFLRIKELVSQCWLCLDNDVHFREDTAFMLYLEARKFSLDALEQMMLMRICRFFLTLVASREFLELTEKEICTLLNSNAIGVNTEIEILMSAVRWLCYKWEEREPAMLNIIRCVRFSLMPAWYLVTLGRSNQCPEIVRIVSNPEVMNTISSSISYTTTLESRNMSREEFIDFLEQYKLDVPVERQWIFDKECKHHHHLQCHNKQYLTYSTFLDYLEMMRTLPKDYWRSLEIATLAESGVKTFCKNPECHQLIDQNSVRWVNSRQIAKTPADPTN